MINWTQTTQYMMRGRPNKKMADFLNIFTLCARKLICAITYQTFQEKERSAVLNVYDNVITIKHLLVFKTFWRRLQHFFSVTIFRLPRRLQGVLEDEKLLRWRRHVLKTSWRHFGDKQNVYWGYLHLTNLNLYLANLYLTNLYLTHLRQI